MAEQFPSQEDKRATQAQHILEEKGIIPHVLVRVEQQVRPGQEDGWEYMGLTVTPEGEPVAEVKKGDEKKYIPAGRLAAWQTGTPESLREPKENPNLYRDGGSARESNAVKEELEQGRE